jgi:hypothetical protein
MSPLIKYLDTKMRRDTLDVIDSANVVITDYIEQGFVLTLRQLYYQMIARDLFPESWIDPVYNEKQGLPATTKNTTKNYGRFGSIVNDARLCGLIDWDAIEDRTRNVSEISRWEKPQEVIESAAQAFRIDKWADQPLRVFCLVEKEALAGVFEPTCHALDVPLLACKGYPSQSEMWALAQRFLRVCGLYDALNSDDDDALAAWKADVKAQDHMPQDIVVLHFGDHDPSGIDMSRDITERLKLLTHGLPFALQRYRKGALVAVERLALNIDQVRRYDPPPNPAKTTDSRFTSYEEVHGDESWELDALEPRVLLNILTTRVKQLRVEHLWDDAVERENAMRHALEDNANRWPLVQTLLKQHDAQRRS